MASAFTLVLPRRPPSLGSGGKHLFQKALRDEAERRFAGQEPLRGDLYVRIVWFHREPTTQDVDNIAKNILDALKGVVFSDDVVVVQCLIRKIHTAARYDLDDRGAPVGVMDDITARLVAGPDHWTICYTLRLG